MLLTTETSLKAPCFFIFNIKIFILTSIAAPVCNAGALETEAGGSEVQTWPQRPTWDTREPVSKSRIQQKCLAEVTSMSLCILCIMFAYRGLMIVE